MEYKNAINDFDTVKSIILSNYNIANSKLAILESRLSIEIFPKGEVFIEQGKLNAKEYFVLEGICRSYLVNEEGENTTLSFFVEGSILTPHLFRTANGKSLLNFEALTDLKLATLDATFLHNLMVEDVEFRDFGNEVLRRELLGKVEKEISLASLSAKERLLNFRKQFPSLENLVPHTAIASYLGITNISLSRLRADIKK